MAIKPRLPSMSANSQTCPELLVQPCSPHLFSHCSTEADKLLHHPDLGRTAGSMGCNRAGGGGYSWEPGQTHLPLDQSHFPFLSLNLSLLVLLSLSSVLFKENGYVMGKFNSMRNHLQHSEHKYYTYTRNNSGSVSWGLTKRCLLCLLCTYMCKRSKRVCCRGLHQQLWLIAVVSTHFTLTLPLQNQGAIKHGCLPQSTHPSTGTQHYLNSLILFRDPVCE